MSQSTSKADRPNFGSTQQNLFTLNVFWPIQINMRHVVTIPSSRGMTRRGGPVEGVAR